MIPVIFARQLGIGLDDMFQYDMLARSLALGNGFRWYSPDDLARLAPFLRIDLAAFALDPRGVLTTFRAPLYPAFLALVYSGVGTHDSRFFAARLAQAFLLGAPLAPLTYGVARKILPNNERAARMAAWGIAAYPMLLVFPLALATENLFFLLVLIGVFILLQSIEKPSSTYFLLAGISLGLAALTRSVILPFAGLAIFWIGFQLKHRRGALLAALALLVTITPWVVRNSLLSHRLTGIETSLGYNLYVGYHPRSTGTFTFGPSLDLLSILDDRARDEIGTKKALEFIQQDPGRFFYLALRRLGYFFNLELRAFSYFYVNDFLGYLASPVLMAVMLILGLPFVGIIVSAVGGAVLLPARPSTTLLVLLFFGYLLPHVFILSEERFHLTLIPLLAVLAAKAWTTEVRAWRSLPRLPSVVAAVVILLLFLNWGFELAREGSLLAQMLGPGGNQLYLPY